MQHRDLLSDSRALLLSAGSLKMLPGMQELGSAVETLSGASLVASRAVAFWGQYSGGEYDGPVYGSTRAYNYTVPVTA